MRIWAEVFESRKISKWGLHEHEIGSQKMGLFERGHLSGAGCPRGQVSVDTFSKGTNVRTPHTSGTERVCSASSPTPIDFGHIFQSFQVSIVPSVRLSVDSFTRPVICPQPSIRHNTSHHEFARAVVLNEAIDSRGASIPGALK